MTQADQLTKDRDAFEVWCKSGGISTEKLESSAYPPGTYSDTRTHSAWVAWQACAAAIRKGAEE